MDCPTCYGRGRIVFDATIGMGTVIHRNVTSIDKCPTCNGNKTIGTREGVMIAVGEMKDGTSVIMEVNPNEAG